MAVRVNGDPAALAPRVRAIAAEIDAGLRPDEIRRLDEMAWSADLPALVVAGALIGIVGLGLFISAGSIFSLVSVTVARRTREIGLRAALGASPRRLLVSMFARPIVLIGSGIAIGQLVLLLLTTLGSRADTAGRRRRGADNVSRDVGGRTAGVCGPARRALRINPVDALKEL